MRDQRALATTAAPVEPITELLKRCGAEHAHYRPGTSDERVLREVLHTNPYRRKRIGFYVDEGEHWMDLGANIGAFAIYARLRGATVECFEPDPGCYDVLLQNARQFDFTAFKVAVTANKEEKLPFWVSKTPEDHHRGTTHEMKKATPAGFVNNLWMGDIKDTSRFDGIKMDIEGAEGPILDEKLLPLSVKKLVLEYHLWRDPSMANLRRRLNFLRTRFSVVSYPPEFDRMLASGFAENTSYYDRLVFCMR